MQCVLRVRLVCVSGLRGLYLFGIQDTRYHSVRAAVRNVAHSPLRILLPVQTASGLWNRPLVPQRGMQRSLPGHWRRKQR